MGRRHPQQDVQANGSGDNAEKRIGIKSGLQKFLKYFNMFNTLDELKEYLCDRGCEEIVVFDNPSYVTAAIGTEEISGRVIYDYEKMVEFLMETDGMTYEDAAEFIDYNTIRAIPYMGTSAPIILYPFLD